MTYELRNSAGTTVETFKHVSGITYHDNRVILEGVESSIYKPVAVVPLILAGLYLIRTVE